MLATCVVCCGMAGAWLLVSWRTVSIRLWSVPCYIGYMDPLCGVASSIARIRETGSVRIASISIGDVASPLLVD